MGSSGGPCRTGASRLRSGRPWAGHRWGSSHSQAPAPSPRSPPGGGSWPAAPLSTRGSVWPGPRGTVSPVTGRPVPRSSSRRTALLQLHLHAPWQPFSTCTQSFCPRSRACHLHSFFYIYISPLTLFGFRVWCKLFWSLSSDRSFWFFFFFHQQGGFERNALSRRFFDIFFSVD